MSEEEERRHRINFGVDMHDRANEAKTDYLSALPGALYRETKEDIEGVWDLLESPIEQVAIFQLAGVDYAYGGKPPIYLKVARRRGEFSHYHYPVQLIPQVAFGNYRVDFLYDCGPRGLLAVECDGADFHMDKKRDEFRDAYLKKHHDASVLRIRGKDIWKNNKAAELVASVVRAWML